MTLDCIRIAGNDVPIEVSAQDERDYLSFTLESNSLQVLVISDPTTEKSAAALDVNVGHLSDPPSLPGLAHFLEHMLFLGTEKYPDENSYSAFLSSHGGSSNAFTSMTDTNYYFDIRPEFLTNALDRFAQFFISPLFTPSATAREINAVDSENAKNLQNDYWRFSQLLKSFANPEHPYHKFGTGNKQTLSDIPTNLHIDVRKALLEFHAKFYSANVMRLVVLGSETIDELKESVTLMFSDIRNTGISPPSFASFGSPFSSSSCLRRHVTVCPVKDLQLIEVSWPLPSLQHLYLAKPSRYLSHVLGHEGTGSLLSFLKTRGFANELSAGLTKDEADWSLFTVTVEATAEGIANVKAVVSAIYNAIGVINRAEPQEWIYNECALLAQVAFRFRNKERPMQYTSSLAGKLQRYKPSHVLTGSSLFREFNPTAISDILLQLVPERMRLTVASKTFEGKTCDNEKWYGTPYSDSEITQEWLSQWTEDLNNTTSGSITLPERNDLIPSDFTLKSNVSPDCDFPELLPSENDDNNYRCWYKYDHTFKKPKLNVFLNIVTPQSYLSPKSVVMTDMILRLVDDSLTESVYDAELAGLKYVLSQSTSGIELFVTGYSHKLPILLYKVLEALRNLNNTIIEKSDFDRILKKTLRSYENFSQEQPYQHAVYNTSYVVEEKKFYYQEKIEALHNIITPNTLSHFITNVLFQNIFVEALVHGNATLEEASVLVSKSFNILKKCELKSSLSKSMWPVARAIKLQESLTNFSFKAASDSEVNSAIQAVFQVGLSTGNIKNRAALELLAHVMKEPCFNTLRTIEQLGYIVFSGVYTTKGVCYYRIIVQSDKMNPIGLECRIEAFLETFEKEVLTTCEDFEKLRQAVVSKLCEKPKTPWEESMRYWPRITKWTYDFDFRKNLAAQVKELTLEDLQEFFRTFVKKDGIKRCLLSCHIYGNKHEVKEGNHHHHYTAMDDYKRRMELYPSQGIPPL